MKIKLISIILIVLSLYSCSDMLDVAPFGRQGLDDMFSEEATVGAYLNGCYENFPRYSNCYSRFTNLGIAQNGDAYEYMPAAEQGINRIYDGTVTADKNIYVNNPGPGGPVQFDFRDIGYWDLMWRNIRRCNVFLSRIGDAVVTSESLRNRWTAEAKVLRAFYYLDLISRYGAMPISDGPFSANLDLRTLRKNTFKECVEFIIRDCDEAIVCEDLPWRISTNSEKERLTRGVAAAIKSRAILFLASDLWNDGNDYWEEAERITLETLNQCLNNGYELYTQVLNPTVFETAYHEYHCSQIDYSADPIDKETILASTGPNGRLWVYENGLPIQAAFKAGLCPSQELVDAYCMQQTGLPVLDLEQPYQDEVTHLIPNYYLGSGYDPENPYVGRDLRFYATVHYNGSKRKNPAGVITTLDIFKGGNCEILIGNNKRTQTGYYLKKYDHPEAQVATRESSGIAPTYRIFHLSELYLNYAEAAVENGNIPQAVQAVKAIRDRANMPNINPQNQEKARLMVRNERRVELAFEENRYMDIRRWTKPDGNMEKVWKNVSCMWIEKNLDGTFQYHRGIAGDVYNSTTGTWLGTGRVRACYTNQYLFWPLNTVEANRLESATGQVWQNPGW